MKLSSFVASLLSVLLLAACASVQNVSLDKANRAPLKSIALLKIGVLQHVEVHDFSHIAALGGAIGGAIQGVVNAKRGRQFLQAVNDRNVKFSDIMVSDLKSEFQESEIQIEYLSDKSPKIAKDGKSDDYSDIATDKDAILEVWFGPVGFANMAKFRPPDMVALRG